jgi:tetratricopeptide (TPR) repeat protein
LQLKAQAYQDVLDSYSNLSTDLQSSWWALLDKGSAENHLNDPTSAKSDLSKALGLAASANDSKMINRAVQEMARELGPPQTIMVLAPYANKSPATLLPLAMLFHVVGDAPHAIEMLNAAVTEIDKMSPTDQIAALTMAGQIYQTAVPPLPDQAYAVYTRLLKLEPDDTTTLNNIACLLADSYTPTRAQEGLPYIQKAADKMNASGQTDPNILDTQGWLLVLTGNPAQGVTLLNQAMTSQQTPEMYFHLAQGYLMLQYADEANKDAQAGLDMLAKQDPSNQQVKLKTKLTDVIARSQELMKSKQQAQVP